VRGHRPGLGTPKGLTVDPDGTVYIADLGTSTLGPIRVVAPNDKDDDGFPDWVETGTGTYTGPTDTGTSGVRGDTDSDGCGDAAERRLVPPIDPNDPWDYYSVPVPALISAPDPTTDFRNNVVSAGDGQAVFAYFKVGAVAGSQVYEQDLNQNGIKDGEEYDRSALGVAKSGPPDGVVGAVDAQVAFSQFKSSYAC